MKRKWNSTVMRRLEVARRLFSRFDNDQSGYLGREEVKLLVQETYNQMGMNYSMAEKEVDDWIRNVDRSGTQKVSLDDYEAYVLDSLRKQGIQMD